MPEKKKSVVPPLRFPEFRDAGEWEVKAIVDLAEKIAQGGTPSTTNPAYWNGGIPWVTPAEMGNDAAHHYLMTTNRNISKLGLENSSAELLPPNSVIISSRAPIGYVAINKVPMATNQGCKGIIPNNSVYYEFLYFSLINAKRMLNDLGAGAGFKELSSGVLRSFRLPVPQVGEQQKIADCLSSLDEVIDLEAQKLEALKAHKKGLMQQLFPREGETTPRLRFPEFRDAGEWERKNGDVVFQQMINKKHNSDLPVLAITQEHGAIPRNLIDYHVSVSQESLNSYKVVEPGDFIISLRTFQGGIEYSRYKGICSPAYIVLRKRISIYDLFFKHYFKTDVFIKQLNKNVEGLRDGKMVSFKQFSELLLPYPPLLEQQKIADCLSSLDEVIDLQTQKLDALKAHKKGLMQQLFPSEVD
jgi:type I restriction enzyme S subunit